MNCLEIFGNIELIFQLLSTKFFTALLRKIYSPAKLITHSFSPQKKGQSSLFSRKSGCSISRPGTTPPATKEKSALVLP